MLRGFFGNLIFAIIARMLSGNHLKLINSKNLTQCRDTTPKEPLDNSFLLYLRRLERKVCQKELRTKGHLQKPTAIENIYFSIFLQANWSEQDLAS